MTPFESILETIQNITGCSSPVAEKVYRYYVKEKIVKIDSVNGSVRWADSAFLDKDVLERCIERVKESCSTCALYGYNGTTLEDEGAGDLCYADKKNPLPLIGESPDNCPKWITDTLRKG